MPRYDELGSGLFHDDKTPSPGLGDRSVWRLAGVDTGPMLVIQRGDRVYTVSLTQHENGKLTTAGEAALRERTLPLAKAALAAAG